MFISMYKRFGMRLIYLYTTQKREHNCTVNVYTIITDSTRSSTTKQILIENFLYIHYTPLQKIS